MKKHFVVLFSVIVFIGITSCGKECIKKNKNEDYYYSEDYKTSGAALNGVEFSELTALWSVFYTEGKSKDLRYKLVGEKGDKKDVIWEEGTVIYSGLDVTFIADYSSIAYYASFDADKETYTVVFPNQDQREVTFSLK